jgi:ABC-2 type transport system ATP-binding protein
MVSARTHSLILSRAFRYSQLLGQDIGVVNELAGLAISVRGLRKTYTSKANGSKDAVAGIDLDVKAGEIFAILGPNGAGKTTTVEILEGYRDRDGGEVSVLGQDPAKLGSDSWSWRNRIGIVLQSTNDSQDLSVAETVHHFANYYSNPRDPEAVINEVGLTDKAQARIQTLSGGQRRRLDVALGIIGNPEILFLDEPTTGFDPEARRAFWDLIRKLRDEGTTILLTTHYLDEAEALADRVAVIVDGKIIEVSTPENLGGRNTAKARISWLENGIKKEIESDFPAAEVAKLSSRFSGEVPELTVIRPSLEDIYLKMIGQA